jgi:hypothetical protein
MKKNLVEAISKVLHGTIAAAARRACIWSNAAIISCFEALCFRQAALTRLVQNPS